MDILDSPRQSQEFTAVRRQFIDYVKLSFLVTGHTHEDVDQFFSRISTSLKRSEATTLPELIDTPKIHIALLLDTCTAHPDVQLRNILLVFLPANTTSILQPLDQGIIRNLMALYLDRRGDRRLATKTDSRREVTSLISLLNKGGHRELSSVAWHLHVLKVAELIIRLGKGDIGLIDWVLGTGTATACFHWLLIPVDPLKWRFGQDFLGEQGLEQVHALFNNIGLTTCGIADPVARLRSTLTKHLIGGRGEPHRQMSGKVTGPWDNLGMDLIGPLPTTWRGNRYIFSATDYFTKWVEAFPIKTKSAEDVAACIMKMYARHGAAKAIITDQGGDLNNKQVPYVKYTNNRMKNSSDSQRAQYQTKKENLCTDVLYSDPPKDKKTKYPATNVTITSRLVCGYRRQEEQDPQGQQFNNCYKHLRANNHVYFTTEEFIAAVASFFPIHNHTNVANCSGKGQNQSCPGQRSDLFCTLESGSVLLTGYVAPDDYGITKVKSHFDGRRFTLTGHCLVYLLYSKHKMSSGMHVSHICHQKLCINMSHLSYKPPVVNLQPICVSEGRCTGQGVVQ
ncbi:Gypsy retrotransposon integrase-like protein 1 [Branchiostoma belcheri]|nr:Gypsy retrotransposon integrase-like protein 1 [Branchiostoma belcheri]